MGLGLILGKGPGVGVVPKTDGWREVSATVMRVLDEHNKQALGVLQGLCFIKAHVVKDLTFAKS